MVWTLWLNSWCNCKHVQEVLRTIATWTSAWILSVLSRFKSVRLKRSTGFPRGWWGVFRVFVIPAVSQSSLIEFDSRSGPWSECKCSGMPYGSMKSFQFSRHFLLYFTWSQTEIRCLRSADACTHWHTQKQNGVTHQVKHEKSVNRIWRVSGAGGSAASILPLASERMSPVKHPPHWFIIERIW